MNIDYYLPKPTEDELNLGYKTDYFTRILDMDLDKKYKLTQEDLTCGIHHNYQSVFLLDQELNLTQVKKLR
jgi:hypothetical protein